jgi:hypothetical protein
MTNEEYVTSNGNKCPFCGKDDLRGGNYDMTDNDTIYYAVMCNDCGAQWDDIFKLTGFEEFTEATVEKREQ